MKFQQSVALVLTETNRHGNIFLTTDSVINKNKQKNIIIIIMFLKG